MFTVIQLALCLMSQSITTAPSPARDPIAVIGTPAMRYAAIVAAHDKNNTREKQSSEKGQQASTAMRQELQELLDWASKTNGRFAAEDFLALAEAATILKKPREAVAYAREATKDAGDVRPYVALVHALCGIPEMRVAEEAAAEAAKRFPSSKQLYLLYDFIALKHRALKEPERASGFMKATIEAVLDHVEDGPFYVSHLGKCIDAQRELATAIGRQGELKECLESWRDSLSRRVEERLATAKEADGRLRLREEDLKAVGLDYQAAMAIHDRMTGGNSELVCKQWLETLAACERQAEVIGPWFTQSKLALDHVGRALSPRFGGGEVERLLSHLEEKYAKEVPADEKNKQIHSLFLAHIKATIRLLQQHQGHQRLVGAMVAEDGLKVSSSVGSVQSYVLLHICDPSSPNMRLGLAQATRLNGPVGDKVPRKIIAAQSGLAWDAGNKRFYRAADQTPAQEQTALDELAKSVAVPRGIALLRRDSELYRLLKPELFPVNVLVDGEGKIAGILTGPEREKVDRLLELATSPKN